MGQSSISQGGRSQRAPNLGGRYPYVGPSNRYGLGPIIPVGSGWWPLDCSKWPRLVAVGENRPSIPGPGLNCLHMPYYCYGLQDRIAALRLFPVCWKNRVALEQAMGSCALPAHTRPWLVPALPAPHAAMGRPCVPRSARCRVRTLLTSLVLSCLAKTRKLPAWAHPLRLCI